MIIVNRLKDKWEYWGKAAALVLFFVGAKLLSSSRRLWYVLLLLSMFVLFTSTIATGRKKSIKCALQELAIYAPFGILITTYSLVTKKLYVDSGAFRYSLGFLGLSLVCMAICDLIIYEKNSDRPLWKISLKAIRNNYLLVILIVICIIASFFVFPVQQRWDSATINRQIYNTIVDSNINISNMGYTSHFYYYLMGVIGYVSEWNEKALNSSSLVLYILSIISVHKILQNWGDNKSHFNSYVINILLTLCYAFSPFILGMLGNRTYDLWLMYFFPIIVCAYMYEYWIIWGFCSVAGCFTKQTMIVALFGYFLGLLLIEIFGKHKNLKQLVRESKWYAMLFIGVFWLYGYHIIQVETPCYAYFDIGLIKMNLKMMFILNYNWLISFLILTFILASLFTKKRRYIKENFPLLISNASMIIFYMIFTTVPNTRYLDSYISCKYLLLLTGVAYFIPYIINILTIVVLDLCMISSVWLTTDPISKLCFTTYDLGNGTMLSTEILCDSMVYNAQWKYFDVALNAAMADAVEDDAVIIFPELYDGILYNFEGKYSGYYLAKNVNNNWDETRNIRTVLGNKNTKEIEIQNVYSYEQLLDLDGLENAYFFYIEGCGDEVADKIIANGLAGETNDFEAGPFEVKRIKLFVD